MAIAIAGLQGEINEVDATSVTLESYAVPAGTDKILVVFAGSEDVTAGSQVEPASATFNGVAMTKAVGTFLNNNGAAIFYTLAPSGTADIVVTWSDTQEALGAIALTLTGAKQQAPEATTSGTGTTSPENNAITTITNNAMVIDGITSGQSGTLATTQAGQTEEMEQLLAAGQTLGLAVSSKPVATAGATTLGWSTTPVNRLVHVLTAWEEASAGQTVNLGLATETESVPGALVLSRTVNLGLATETESVPGALVLKRTVNLGLATEIESVPGALGITGGVVGGGAPGRVPHAGMLVNVNRLINR